ncbi:acyl-CoA dehydrogenase [Nocardioides sp. zg-579]|uniref:Acyl-CoA dehydrogenase n=1 Tax=Nocardioides marmotae TaxID=2663857 RepID=A0A6I3J2M6_9ACTN|nr:acyl-CoA dehydrogenase [Nocardioides marmotae]MCR6031107.1 acyl-CoA dehydrogenase [Gordonia jinghuaiqii]MTB94746.1 acyl-CoA dehydrogenase [Nocardioides marmotae]QKE01256.1 acyl-CoA dehydrogenase [Nocardioides marmotae]
MDTDGYTEADAERAESLDAVRSVITEALERGGGDWRTDWAALAADGLTALPVPAEHGGEGLGLAEVAVLLRETGARARHLPVWETLCCGALVLAAHGTEEQRQALLPGVAAGDLLLTPAIREVGAGLTSGLTSAPPATRYDGGTVSGRKVGVTYADAAARLLVTATGSDGEPVLVLVDPQGPGVELHESPSSARITEHTVVLDGAPAEPVGGPGGGADAARSLREHAVAGLALTAAGLVAGARDLTAAYVKSRTQFGRSLAQFQAVAMQVADVYITSRLADLAAANAAWRVEQRLDVTDDLAVAAYWTCAEAPRAMRTCHHLHGGMGVDETYPMHHYFSWVTDIVRLLDARPEDVHVEDPTTKNLELSADQRALKAELRTYFTGLADQDAHVDMGRDRHGPTYQRVVRQMGTDGWMGVGWPQEYGGHGLGEIEQTIFANEAQRADVHLPAVTLQTVGPTLIRYGTEKQKDLFLKRILAGDVHFAIGYSEPDAGTDLASLRTTARRDGDHYVVNGQKLWTTGGHQADYVWLAVRTDPDAPKHKGISILIVDTTDPGYSFTPIITADGSHHVNATYYNDVRVPVDMLVGEENQGWKLITTQLNHERVMLGPAGRIEGLRDRVLDWATKAGVADHPDVVEVMGRVTAVLRVNELLNWEVARAAATGEISVGDASSSKVFAADQVQHLADDLTRIVHRYGDPAEAETRHLVEYLDAQAKRNLVLTFGGGVQEVQRELIAMFGLGLPRVPR